MLTFVPGFKVVAGTAMLKVLVPLVVTVAPPPVVVILVFGPAPAVPVGRAMVLFVGPTLSTFPLIAIVGVMLIVEVPVTKLPVAASYWGAGASTVKLLPLVVTVSTPEGVMVALDPETELSV